MAEYPALPLFTDAYLADTAHLTDAENGCYIRLLFLMWRSPQCQIPHDKEWLARRLGKTIEIIEKEVMPLVCEFCTIDGKWLFQKRLRREFTYLKNRSQRQRQNANARWDKGKDLSHSHANGIGLAYAPHPTPPIEDASASSTTLPPERNGHDKRSRGTRLPTSWEPSAEDAQFAESIGLIVADITAEFRDYWCAIPGSKGLKLDWSATFRNRCREVAGRAASRGGGGRGPSSRRRGALTEAAGSLLSEIDDRGRGRS